MLLDYFTHALATMLVTIDPIGLAPIFIAVTHGMTSDIRFKVGKRAAIVAVMILWGAALLGTRILDFLGITLPAFRIAGGLLLFSIAFEMVFQQREKRRAVEADAKAIPTVAEDYMHLAVFPLAIPLMAGPGAISATVLLSSQAPDLLSLGILLAVIAGLSGGCLIVFSGAEQLDRRLGSTGRTVSSRLLGVILAALAVQFVADGIAKIVQTHLV